MSYSKNVSEKLNELLEKNYDSEKIYKEAAEKTEDHSLKMFFEAKAKQRYDFGHELKDEIRSMGEKPDKGTSSGTDLKAKFLELKNAVLGTSDKSLLNKTIKADENTLKHYDEVIKEVSTYPSTHQLLIKQRDAIYNTITDVDVTVESMTAPNKK